MLIGERPLFVLKITKSLRILHVVVQIRLFGEFILFVSMPNSRIKHMASSGMSFIFNLK
jgi:hypothetical protein